MRRLIIIGLLVAIVPWIVIGIVREATDDDTKDAYFVRADLRQLVDDRRGART